MIPARITLELQNKLETAAKNTHYSPSIKRALEILDIGVLDARNVDELRRCIIQARTTEHIMDFNIRDAIDDVNYMAQLV